VAISTKLCEASSSGINLHITDESVPIAPRVATSVLTRFMRGFTNDDSWLEGLTHKWVTVGSVWTTGHWRTGLGWPVSSAQEAPTLPQAMNQGCLL
jgi:hypothetical protein